MRSLLSLEGLLSCLLLSRSVLAAPSPGKELDIRGPGSCHTASNRACWSDGYDIHTDFEKSTPPGSLKKFNWEISEYDNWQGPDGFVKSKVMLVNKQLPGPALVADWGDTIQVTIKNNLKVNGTSIHWHGIRQLGTNIQDGVNGVTECPIPPGGTKTYTFKATQYGTSWYHSHFSAQYGNGVFGPIVINGPASLPYDIDLGAYPIFDYYYSTADQIVDQTLHTPAPPLSDNVLFNGTNINPRGPGGKYSKITLTPGKRHRLRLINPSVEHNYQVSIVNHQMTVISTDFVPVNSYTTSNVFLGVGQRVDVTIDASQAVGNYWLNVTMYAANLCGASVNSFPASIVHYAGASDTANPTVLGTAPPNTHCMDSLDYVPVVARTAPLDSFNPSTDHTLDVTLETPPTSTLVTWKVNNSSINVDWDRPVLEYVLEGNTSYPRSENIVVVNGSGNNNSNNNTWTFWVIENESILDHPMHLHGHDFLVLGASAKNAGAFTAADKGQLRASNPVRRDVTMLPAGGWLVLAFQVDNPGAWLFHCHIAWHVSGGLSVDFLERVGEQKAQISAADQAAFSSNCAAWQKYYATSPQKKADSGLKARRIEILS
ncbi:probing oxygen channels in Melanocarpus Albomyces laccase [Xylariomycetidae sp. FL2044]|nr:probing oxygen channels in Melanocarpus Albomyces laccase [Xylariomycetidae sp. FL2044]